MVDGHVMDMLEAFGAPAGASDGIFGVTAKMITAHWSQKYLKPACEAAGIERFTPYALRRLSIQLDARNGINMGHSAKRHGNSVAVIAAHYQQFNDEDEREAFKKTATARRRRVSPYREARNGRTFSADTKQGQKARTKQPPFTQKPPIPSDIGGKMAHPGGVEAPLERRGKPCFFEIGDERLVAKWG